MKNLECGKDALRQLIAIPTYDFRGAIGPMVKGDPTSVARLVTKHITYAFDGEHGNLGSGEIFGSLFNDNLKNCNFRKLRTYVLIGISLVD